MPKIPLYDSFQFQPNLAAIKTALTEAAKGSRDAFPLAVPGWLSRCDEVNGNNRIYPEAVWKRNIAEGSKLQETVKNCRSLGLLEHPADGKVTLNSPISHLVTRVFMEGKEVGGELTLVGTAEGRKMAALIEAGYNPTVSSRGYGSVVKDASGVDVVQDDFVCESWDIVGTPSFEMATLNTAALRSQLRGAIREDGLPPSTAINNTTTSVDTTSAEDKTLEAEGYALVTDGGEQVVLKTKDGKLEVWAKFPAKPNGPCLKGSNCWLAKQAADTGLPIKSTPTTSTPSPLQTEATFSQPSQPDTTMDIKTLTESVRALAAQDTTKLEPGAIAEARAAADGLHRDIDVAIANKPELAWTGRQLHEKLSAFAGGLDAAVAAPRALVTKLQEQQVNTLKVIKLVSEAGLGYKKKLGVSLVEATRLAKVNAILAERAKGWEQRALLAEKRNSVAYAALDELKEQYHDDTAALGKKLLRLEFAPTDQAILNRIEEAVKAEDLVVIRDELKKKLTEGKPAEDGDEAKEPKKKKETDEEKALRVKAEKKANDGRDNTDESKKLGKDGKPIVEAKPPGPILEAKPVRTVEVSTTRRAFSISESVASAQRLNVVTRA